MPNLVVLVKPYKHK